MSTDPNSVPPPMAAPSPDTIYETPDLVLVEAQKQTTSPGPTLRNRSFSGGDLSDKSFRASTLENCDFSGANCQRADFQSAFLKSCCFRGTDLRGATFLDTTGLPTCDFSLSDLGSADLPGKDFDSRIDALTDTTKQLRTFSQVILVACAYVALTIATTRDVDLIVNASTSQLPIISVSVPLALFYITAPVLLMALHIHFIYSVLAACELFTGLPIRFPDGRHLETVVSFGLVWSGTVVGIKEQHAAAPVRWIATVFQWALVPITQLLIWYRYLSRQDVLGTSAHLPVIALTIAVTLLVYSRVVRRLVELSLSSSNIQFNLRNTWLILASIMIPLLIASTLSRQGWWATANLKSLEISTRPISAAGITKGAELAGRRLVGANLSGSYLGSANLEKVDASFADFSDAQMTDANLRNASLRSAKLNRARLGGADFSGVDLSFTDFRGAVLSPKTIIAEKWRLIVNVVNHDELGVDLIGRDFTDALLIGADLGNVSLAYAKFDRSDLRGANLVGTILVGASLVNTDLTRVDLRRASLQDSDLSGAKLSHVELQLVNLKGTKIDERTFMESKWRKVWEVVNTVPQRALTDLDLSDSYLRSFALVNSRLAHLKLVGADLTNADFNGSSFENVDVGGATLGGVDFRGADLCGIRNLTREQLFSACVNEAALHRLSKCAPQLTTGWQPSANKCRERK